MTEEALPGNAPEEMHILNNGIFPLFFFRRNAAVEMKGCQTIFSYLRDDNRVILIRLMASRPLKSAFDY